MSIKKNSIITYSASLVALAFSVLTTLIISRVLGPSGKGAYTILTLIPYLAFLLGNLGLGHASTYYLCKDEDAESVISNLLLMAIILSVPFAIILSLVVKPLHSVFLKETDPMLVILSIWMIPPYFYILYLNNVFLARDILRYNAIYVLQIAAPPLLFLVALISRKPDLNTAMGSWAIGITITAIAAVWLLRGILMHRPVLKLEWHLLSKSIKYGMQMYMYYLTQFLNFRLDYFLVGIYLPLAQVGFYSIATAIAEIAARLPSAVGMVVFPATASMDEGKTGYLIAKATRQTLFLVTITILTLLVSSKLIILVCLGSGFIPALRPLIILLPGMLGLCIFRILVNGVAGMGRPEFGARAGFAAFAATVLLDVMLIPSYGIDGAALASTIAYSLAAFVILYYLVLISEVSFSDVLLIKASDFQGLRNSYMRAQTRFLALFSNVKT